METKNRTDENEKGDELYEHGSRLDHVGMPQDCWNGNTSNGRCTRQEFCGINPAEKKEILTNYNKMDF